MNSKKALQIDNNNGIKRIIFLPNGIHKQNVATTKKVTHTQIVFLTSLSPI